MAPPKPRGILSAALEPLDGPDVGTPVDIPKGEITLGRASSNNAVVESPAVSKVHARVERTADVVTIQDLDSVNGTFVNDTRIDTPVVLGRRDRISLAGVRSFQVNIERAGRDTDTPASGPPSVTGPVFSQEWKTRLVWSAEELAELADLAQPTPIPATPPEPKKPARTPRAAPAKAAPKAADVAPDAAQPAATRTAEPKPAAPAKPSAPPEPVAPAKPPAPPKPATGSRAPAGETPTIFAASGGPEKAAPQERHVRLVGEPPCTLATGTTTIGRGTTADLRLDDRKASRAHARITVSVETVAIEDAGSVNGTIVNGKEIVGLQALVNGDRVKIGDTEWTIEIS